MQVGYDAVPWQLRSSSESDPSGAGVAKWKMKEMLVQKGPPSELSLKRRHESVTFH